MNKRVILAIGLSFLVLFSWQAFIAKVYHIDNKGVASNNLNNKDLSSEQNSSSPSTFGAASLPIPPSASSITETITLDRFETNKLQLEFINPGAKVYRVHLKDYKLNSEITGGLHSKLFENEIYTLEKSSERVETKVAKNGHYLIQRLNFHNNSYYI